jgi:hypothetical protein
MSGIISQLLNSNRFVSSSLTYMLRAKVIARHHLSWMFLIDFGDNAHSRETLDNPTLLVQTTTETVTHVVTDTITMRDCNIYDSVSYVTQTNYFGIERPMTVYEAIKVEPSILPSSNVKYMESMVSGGSCIF